MMAFQFSRSLAANLANPAKEPTPSGFAPVRSDANPANPRDPFDDRIRCTDCCQLASNGVCRAAGPQNKPVVANRGYQPIKDQFRRCEGFTPYGDSPDRRRGFERWPSLSWFHSLNPAAGSNATRPTLASRGDIAKNAHQPMFSPSAQQPARGLSHGSFLAANPCGGHKPAHSLPISQRNAVTRHSLVTIPPIPTERKWQ